MVTDLLLLFRGLIVFAVALRKVAGVVNLAIDGLRVVDGLAMVAAAALLVVNDSCHTLTISQVTGQRGASPRLRPPNACQQPSDRGTQ